MHAPYNGVIARRFVQEQQSVRAQTPIVLFQDVGEIFIAVDVPESADGRRDSARLIPRASEQNSAVCPDYSFRFVSTRSLKSADPTTQTFKVRFAMKVPPNVNLLPGMTVHGYSCLPKTQHRLVTVF